VGAGKSPTNFFPRIRNYPKQVAGQMVEANKSKTTKGKPTPAPATPKLAKSFSDTVKGPTHPVLLVKVKKGDIDGVPEELLTGNKRVNRNRSLSRNRQEPNAVNDAVVDKSTVALIPLPPAKSEDSPPSWVGMMFSQLSAEFDKKRIEDREFILTTVDSRLKTIEHSKSLPAPIYVPTPITSVVDVIRPDSGLSSASDSNNASLPDETEDGGRTIHIVEPMAGVEEEYDPSSNFVKKVMPSMPDELMDAI